MSWFYERLRMGKWSPVKVCSAPSTVSVAGKTKIRSVNGIAEEVRNVTEIRACLDHLTLDQLAEVYGQDGRFRAVAG